MMGAVQGSMMYSQYLDRFYSDISTMSMQKYNSFY